MRIGFVGLGHMGGPMARNLARRGHTLVGYDVAGSGSLVEAVEEAECVITMLPGGRQVLEVYAEALAHAPPGALFIDCSTIDVADARAAHAAAAAARMESLDAPVSGGVVGATAATLTFMCGGEALAFGRAEPVLSAMGRRIVHCGAAGAGQAAKICNNMILGISMAAVCEAFVLGERLGLSHQALFEVAANASGQCWALTTNCPVPGPVPDSPANREYRAGFATALMCKDLRLAAGCAAATGTAASLGAAALGLFEAYAAAGGGETDFSGVIEHVRGAAKSGSVG